MKKYYQQGFTLIELLVVIAIIGILAAVILNSLGQTRGRARIASVQETLHGLQAGAASCLNDSIALDLPTETQDGGAGPLCTNSASSYGMLPIGWVYCGDGTTGGDTAGCTNASTTAISSQNTGQDYTIIAASAVENDNSVVVCTNLQCITY